MTAKKFRNKNLHKYDELNEATLKYSYLMRNVSPLTENQKRVFTTFHNKNLCLHGVAGTGKTFISFYLSLKEIINNYGHPYKKLIILRSIVSSRDVGFLPGNIKEKTKVYEAPYYAICDEMFDGPQAYETLKRQGLIEFLSTSYVRGITLNDCIVLVDEIQNQTAQELNSAITRVGRNCKMILCGDLKQNDLVNHRETTGLFDFLKIIESMKEFELVEFGVNDITRSELVKSYIIARDILEETGVVRPL